MKTALRRAIALICFLGMLSACSGSEEVGVNGAKASPTPTGEEPDDVAGGVDGPGGATPSPSPAASTPPGSTVSAVGIAITPIQVSITLPAAAGAGEIANFPTSAQLSAVVTFSNGSRSSQVTWQSASPDIAVVNETGMVSAVAPGTGAGPWIVVIRARSLDQKATATRNVTVTSEGRLKVDVE